MKNKRRTNPQAATTRRTYEGELIERPMPGFTPELVARFWAKVDKSADCWLWAGSPHDPERYGAFWGDNRHHSAHRLSYQLHFGVIPSGLLVCHRCDVKRCVRPDHLYAGTTTENLRDAVERGQIKTGAQSWSATHLDRVARGDRNGARARRERMPRGERHGMAKLSEATVLAVRADRERGLTYAEISSTRGIAHSTVAAIIVRRLWKHV